MANSDYWDAAYTSGEFRHWESEYPSPELAAIIAGNLISEGARVLDIGCGGGLDAIFMAKNGFEVTGLDSSAAAIEIARQRGKQAHVKVVWRHGDALNLPIEDDCIDFVNDRGVFHIIEEADRRQYGSELFRILKRGGMMLIRGSSQSRAEHFNPVTERAIDKHFPRSRFHRGPVLPIPLISSAGVMEGRMVILTKVANQRQGGAAQTRWKTK